MFHSHSNLYFGRTADGHVRIVKFDGALRPHALWVHKNGCLMPTEYPQADGEFHDVKIVLDLRLTPQEWASVVSSVSAGGEDSGRFCEALNFHMDHPASPSTKGDGNG